MTTPDREQAGESPLLCPSARCEEGATLLGIVNARGRVTYVRPQVEVDAGFVEEARRGRAPERRFRFASPCVEAGCSQWTGSRCGVADMAIGAQRRGEVPAVVGPLPACTIRPSCRWFAQAGREACGVCPLVVTDARLELPAATAG